MRVGTVDHYETHVTYHLTYVEWIDRHKPYGHRSNARWHLEAAQSLISDKEYIAVREGTNKYSYMPENWTLGRAHS